MYTVGSIAFATDISQRLVFSLGTLDIKGYTKEGDKDYDVGYILFMNFIFTFETMGKTT